MKERILIHRDDRQISQVVTQHLNAIPFINKLSDEFRKLEIGQIINSEIFKSLLNNGLEYAQELFAKKINENFTDSLIRQVLNNVVPDYSGLKKAIDKMNSVLNGLTVNIEPELFQFDEEGYAIFPDESKILITERFSHYLTSEKELIVYQIVKKIGDAINELNLGLPNSNFRYSPEDIDELLKEENGKYVPGVGILYPAKFYNLK